MPPLPCWCRPLIPRRSPGFPCGLRVLPRPQHRLPRASQGGMGAACEPDLAFGARERAQAGTHSPLGQGAYTTGSHSPPGSGALYSPVPSAPLRSLQAPSPLGVPVADETTTLAFAFAAAKESSPQPHPHTQSHSPSAPTPLPSLPPLSLHPYPLQSPWHTYGLGPNSSFKLRCECH